MQPQIILLKEGTDSSQGRGQLLSNISACVAVAAAVETTLGPRGMDKLIVQDNGQATISNDGATILKLLNVVHPAARTIVDIAASQDAEVGDGTTSVVLLAASVLRQLRPLIEDGVHAQLLVTAIRQASSLLQQHISSHCVQFGDESCVVGSGEDGKQEGISSLRRDMLLKCAVTSLQSKLVHQQRDMFASMVVDAVLALGVNTTMPLNMIGFKLVPGGALEESEMVVGVAFKKTFSYAGFEMQPKSYRQPSIALLNIELELKAERDNAEIRLDNVQEYQRVVDAEWNILYDKLSLIAASGARIVLSRLPIGDVATQFFADRDMFCAGRVAAEDMARTQRSCGGSVVASAHDLNQQTLAKCGLFVERQIGGDRYNVLTECSAARACTFLLRGGGQQFLDETQRSLHDAVMIVRRAVKHHAVVAGGGAIEMKLSSLLRRHSLELAGKKQLIMAAVARALEIIPRQLCVNAGLDPTVVLNQLRVAHCGEKTACWHGVDIEGAGVADNMVACVWEPAVVKQNALTAALEAVALLLSIDETVKSPKAAAPAGDSAPFPRG